MKISEDARYQIEKAQREARGASPMRRISEEYAINDGEGSDDDSFDSD